MHGREASTRQPDTTASEHVPPPFPSQLSSGLARSANSYERAADLRLVPEAFLVGFKPDLEAFGFAAALDVFDLIDLLPARPESEVVRLVEVLRPAEVDFRLFADLLVFLARVAEVEAVRPEVDFLRPPEVVAFPLELLFERVVSPEAAPIRAPDTAPVKAPVTARLKNPPVRLGASMAFCAPVVDLDFFLAMCPNLNEAPGEIKSPNTHDLSPTGAFHH